MRACSSFRSDIRVCPDFVLLLMFLRVLSPGLRHYHQIFPCTSCSNCS